MFSGCIERDYGHEMGCAVTLPRGLLQLTEDVNFQLLGSLVYRDSYFFVVLNSVLLRFLKLRSIAHVEWF